MSLQVHPDRIKKLPRPLTEAQYSSIWSKVGQDLSSDGFKKVDRHLVPGFEHAFERADGVTVGCVYSENGAKIYIGIPIPLEGTSMIFRNINHEGRQFLVTKAPLIYVDRDEVEQYANDIRMITRMASGMYDDYLEWHPEMKGRITTREKEYPRYEPMSTNRRKGAKEKRERGMREAIIESTRISMATWGLVVGICTGPGLIKYAVLDRLSSESIPEIRMEVDEMIKFQRKSFLHTLIGNFATTGLLGGVAGLGIGHAIGKIRATRRRSKQWEGSDMNDNRTLSADEL